jgi:hypothetical protein
MTDLLECIRIALAPGATSEQKQAGGAACCAVYAALSPPPGVSLTAPQPRIGVDQVLELAIGKLRGMLPAESAAQVTISALHFPFLDTASKAP